MRRWAGLLAVLVLALTAAPAPAAGGRAVADGTGRPDGGGIGIRLLEASVNRRDDPRARVFIVDHMNPGSTITRRFEIRNTSPRPQRVGSTRAPRGSSTTNSCRRPTGTPTRSPPG